MQLRSAKIRGDWQVGERNRFGWWRAVKLGCCMGLIAAALCWGGLSSAQAAATVTVDPTIEYQEIAGFGTDLAWWAHRVGGWSEPARGNITKLIFDREEGLGFTTVRFNIGAGENPACPFGDHLSPRAKIQGYRPTEAGPYDWTAAVNQRWVLQHAKDVYGVTDLEANALRPPWGRTVSGWKAGAKTPATPNVKEECFDDYAVYLAHVLEQFRDEWGVSFVSLSPFNEPEVGWWVAGSPQEGCYYTGPLMEAMVDAVGSELDRRELSTTVCSPDTYSVGSGVEVYRSFGREARSRVGTISSHSYQGSRTDRYGFRDLLLSEGKPGMMSEVCHAGRPEGHTHTGMRCALEMAWQITTDVRDMGVTKWFMWTPVIDEFYNVNDVWNANDNWGPIHARFTGPEAEQYWLAKEFYAIAHYTRFIRPGHVVVDVDHPQTLATFDPASRELVLVVYNETTESLDYGVRISSASVIPGSPMKVFRTTAEQNVAPLPPILPQDGAFRDTLPAESITTYVIPISSMGETRRMRINDNVRGGAKGQFEYRGDWRRESEETPVASWMSVLDADYYQGWGTGPYSNDLHLSQQADDVCVFRFEGTQVDLYGPRGERYGIAAISLDGGSETVVDCYSPQERNRFLFYSSGPLAPGAHSLTVRVTGEKSESATASFVAVDEALVSGGKTAPSAGPDSRAGAALRLIAQPQN